MDIGAKLDRLAELRKLEKELYEKGNEIEEQLSKINKEIKDIKKSMTK